MTTTTSSNKPQFTPGPWSKHDCFDATGKRLTSRDIVPFGGHSLNGVAVLASVFSNEQDARLIAAAPELYETLNHVRELLVAYGPRYINKAVELADAALAKARVPGEGQGDGSHDA